ncbi:dihydrofolate reductase [Gammaproteobacteria bacterium]|nr:dihydrofolate reductase [Gammaproteobacteria bacterium]
MQKITLVAAIDLDFGIGFKGHLPWHIKEDLKDFQAYTNNKPMIIGRKSFESLGETPLKNRPTVVISQSKVYPHVPTTTNIAQALALFPAADEIIIAGGTRVYTEALPICTHMRLTHIGRTFTCDTYFPTFDKHHFVITEQKPLIWEAQPECEIKVITYQQIDIPLTKK